jgi:hypothetical protein
MSDTYKDHGHPPGWENEHDPRCQACAQSELASSGCSASVLSFEDMPATLRKLSYHVDDMKIGCREFEKMLDDEGWRCLEGFRIMDNRFTITLWKQNK